MDKKYRTRLAPSPTGALHLGNARTFLINYLAARSENQQIVMRMEDLDGPRVKAGAVEQSYEDLHWLGITWDEGPSLGGNYSPYVQSERHHLYEDALKKLSEKGFAYPCVCTRKEIAASVSAPHAESEGLHYPGLCRDRFKNEEEAFAEKNRPPSWRFRVPDRDIHFTDGVHGEQVINVYKTTGDFVITRADKIASYQLAVVVDDAAMDITHIVRGDDLLPSTARQILIYEALGLNVPKFYHVPLVVGQDGRRLAKRHGDTRVSALREAGYSSEKVIGLLAYWCGLVKENTNISADELINIFSWNKLPKAQVICRLNVEKK